jgi:spore coat protein H
MIQVATLLAAAVLSCFACGLSAAESKSKNVRTHLRPKDIFGATNVWTVHLRFTREQWEAMTPKEGAQPGRSNGRVSMLQGPEGGRNGAAASFFGISYNYVHADLEFGTNRFQDVGVRYKGNGTFLSSRENLKRSFKIDLNEFEKGQKLAGMSQFNLHNSVRDPSGMNETIAYGLFRDGKVPAPRTAYAKVFVTVPGQHDRRYFGLYTLVEDVGTAFAKEQLGGSGGALLKPVTPNLFADLGDDWKQYNQTYDPKGTVSEAQKQRVIEFCKFSSKASDGEFATKLGDYVDIDNLARYMAITTWLSDRDGILGPGQNFYVYLHPKTQKFMFIPWDQDQTFGQFPRGTDEQREKLSIHKPWTGANRFLARVYKSESFKKAYLTALRDFNDTIFQPQRIERQVDELATLLRALIQEESAARLAGFNKAVAGEKVTINMGPGFPPGTQVKPIKAFVPARNKSVSEQLAGKS